jgi:hypothetical protein
LSRFLWWSLESMTHTGRPAGPFSIGRALEIPPGSVNDDLRLAVEAIDRIHGVGHLPRIPMEFRNQLGMYGRFDFDEMTGEPIRILIDRRAPHRAFVAVHEIGHFLDMTEFGEGPNFGSGLNPLTSDWLLAVTSSEVYLKLSALCSLEPSFELLDLLRAEELWARTYAQYVAIRTGSHELLNGVHTWQSSTRSLHIPLQWEHNDFENIAEAFDALFSKLGWRS